MDWAGSPASLPATKEHCYRDGEKVARGRVLATCSETSLTPNRACGMVWNSLVLYNPFSLRFWDPEYRVTETPSTITAALLAKTFTLSSFLNSESLSRRRICRQTDTIASSNLAYFQLSEKTSSRKASSTPIFQHVFPFKCHQTRTIL